MEKENLWEEIRAIILDFLKKEYPNTSMEVKSIPLESDGKPVHPFESDKVLIIAGTQWDLSNMSTNPTTVDRFKETWFFRDAKYVFSLNLSRNTAYVEKSKVLMSNIYSIEDLKDTLKKKTEAHFFNKKNNCECDCGAKYLGYGLDDQEFHSKWCAIKRG